jgi:hypothetical protein
VHIDIILVDARLRYFLFDRFPFIYGLGGLVGRVPAAITQPQAAQLRVIDQVGGMETFTFVAAA